MKKTTKEPPKFIQLNWNFIRQKDTTLQEKLILGEIYNLSKNKICNANNEHFAKRIDIKKSSVSRSLSNLESKGYINTKIKPKSRNFDRTITINNLLITVNIGLTTDNIRLFDLLTICIESKENIEKNNIELNINNINYPESLNIEAWHLWIKHKTEKSQKYKKTGEETAIKKLCKIAFGNQMLCIEDAVSNNYAGFFTDKFTGQNNGTNQNYNKPQSAGERANQAIRELLA